MKKKMMIFIEGTTFYTKPLWYLFSKHGYQPIGKAVEIINRWYEEENEIYLCSYVKKNRYRFIKSVMDYYGVKYHGILCREGEEQYHDLVEQVVPDVLIEDDCASIGGEKEWCITSVNEELKSKIQSIVVKEFGGIDQVPDLIKK